MIDAHREQPPVRMPPGRTWNVSASTVRMASTRPRTHRDTPADDPTSEVTTTTASGIAATIPAIRRTPSRQTANRAVPSLACANTVGRGMRTAHKWNGTAPSPAPAAPARTACSGSRSSGSAIHAMTRRPSIRSTSWWAKCAASTSCVAAQLAHHQHVGPSASNDRPAAVMSGFQYQRFAADTRTPSHRRHASTRRRGHHVNTRATPPRHQRTHEPPPPPNAAATLQRPQQPRTRHRDRHKVPEIGQDPPHGPDGTGPTPRATHADDGCPGPPPPPPPSLYPPSLLPPSPPPPPPPPRLPPPPPSPPFDHLRRSCGMRT